MNRGYEATSDTMAYSSLALYLDGIPSQELKCSVIAEDNTYGKSF
jgi:hypothetical protein